MFYNLRLSARWVYWLCIAAFFGFGVSRLPSWYGYIGVPFIYAVYLLLPAFFIFLFSFGEANGAGRAGLSGGRCCNRLGRGSDLSAFAVFPGKSNRMRQAAHTKRKRLHAGFEKWRIVWKMVFSCGAYPVRQEKPDRGRPP